MQPQDYETRVRALEAEGCTRSDAQAIIDAEDMRKPEPEFKTFAAFITANPGLALTCQPVGDHTVKWSRKDPYKWLCTLSYGDKSMQFDYSMGCGLLEKYTGKECVFRTNAATHYPNSKKWKEAQRPFHMQPTIHNVNEFELLHRPRKPDLETVLISLSLDSQALQAGCFEYWAGDFGYDEDSREAERIYQACLKIGRDLRRLLGHGLFAELQGCEEC